jgi:hypothetical protein
VFIHGFGDDGAPQMIVDHPTVLDGVPGDEGYSDLRDVQLAVAPPGFDSRAIRSLAELEASGLEIVPADLLVNYPIVPRGSTTATGHPIRLGWYRGEQVEYFDLGMSTAQLGDVYEFVVSSSAAGASGYGGAPAETVEVDPLFVAPATSDAATARAIASVRDIEALRLTVVSTGQVTNRPVIAG